MAADMAIDIARDMASDVAAQHMSKWPNSEWDTKLGLISAQD